MMLLDTDKEITNPTVNLKYKYKLVLGVAHLVIFPETKVLSSLWYPGSMNLPVLAIRQSYDVKENLATAALDHETMHAGVVHPCLSIVQKQHSSMGFHSKKLLKCKPTWNLAMNKNSSTGSRTA
jgi:hypothetical protein